MRRFIGCRESRCSYFLFSEDTFAVANSIAYTQVHVGRTYNPYKSLLGHTRLYMQGYLR